MINLKEMTVEEALMAYGDGSDRFSDAGMIAAGYLLVAEVLRLREVEDKLARVEALIEAGEAGERVVEFSTLRAALRERESK